MTEEVKVWEYRVRKFGSFWSGVNEAEVEEHLNQWGQDGWEVVSAVSFENVNKLTIVARRPLTDRTRRSRTMP